MVDRASTLLIRRLLRQQCRESGAVSGSPEPRPRQRHCRRGCSALSATSRAEASASWDVYYRRTDGKATAGQPCTSAEYAWQVCTVLYTLRYRRLNNMLYKQLPCQWKKVNLDLPQL